MIDSLLRLVAPFNCVGCGHEGYLYCSDCISDLQGKVPSRCFKCMKQTVGFAVCFSCRGNFSMNSVWLCGEYSGNLKKLVHEYKFGLKRGANIDIANLFDQLLPPINCSVIVMSIPTATSRIRLRGFDHAKLFAKSFAARRKLVYYPALCRTNQLRLLGLNRAARQKVIKNSFYVKNKSYLQGAHILLLDDVVTTGSSLSEAARVLKNAGAKRVDCAVIAQTIL